MIFYPMGGDPSGFFDGAENAAFSFPQREFLRNWQIFRREIDNMNRKN